MVDFILHMIDSLLYSVLPFIFVVSVVIFFHELGHFLIGRWLGVKAEVFSLGFGPELLHWTDKYDTRWRLAAWPIGGYVKFYKDENPYSAGEVTLSHEEEAKQAALNAEDYKKTLQGQAVWKRFLIVLAGPVFNFILAIVIFTGVFASLGTVTVKPRIGTVIEGSAAQEAGLKPSDMIISINGNAIDSFKDVQTYTIGSAGAPLTLVIARGNDKLTVIATPKLQEVKTASGMRKIAALGLQSSSDPQDRNYATLSLPQAFGRACEETWNVVDNTTSYLRGLVMGRETADQIAGPIGVAQIASQTARVSYVSLLMLTALFSISVGFMNLFPIPLLDGGHLVFYVLEFVRGRPLSPRTQEFSMRVGMVLVGMLIVFATTNDVLRLFNLQ